MYPNDWKPLRGNGFNKTIGTAGSSRKWYNETLRQTGGLRSAGNDFALNDNRATYSPTRRSTF